MLCGAADSGSVAAKGQYEPSAAGGVPKLTVKGGIAIIRIGE